MSGFHLTRRGLILGGAGLTLAGCDAIVTDPARSAAVRDVAERLSFGWQRGVGREALAQEFSLADLSPVFKANGSTNPQTQAYVAHRDEGFANWRLRVDGLVERPLALSLPQLRALPARTQITRHDCVEGWSAIGQWTGVQLGRLLRLAGARPEGRYVVFHCLDNLDGEEGKGGANTPGQYYESVDMVDAFHPQTIVAYSLNGRALDVAHGAPARLRVERQLGYKHAKYLDRIEVVDSYARYGMGRGGFWEDRGYEWYAGI